MNHWKHSTLHSREEYKMATLTPNEAAQRRDVVIKKPLTGERHHYQGDSVYTVTQLGVVVAVDVIRIFYPWHRIESFTYHTADISVRKVLQGY